MKIAILSDIHGNLLALETVSQHLAGWRPDQVIVAGDVVNRGPYPIECLAFVQEKERQEGWQVVRGNHEDYVLSQAQAGAPRSGPSFEIYRNSYWTYQQLNGHLIDLERMSFQVSLSGPDGREIRSVHASMRGNRDGIYPEDSAQELRAKIASPRTAPQSAGTASLPALPPPAVLAVGHTHRPLVRQIDQTLIVNAGSIGAPFDGDRRASYAQLTWQSGRWQAQIIRLNYDLAQSEQAFFDSGFIDGGGALARLMLAEYRQARPHINHWLEQYGTGVLSGQINIDTAVDEYLAHLPKM